MDAFTQVKEHDLNIIFVAAMATVAIMSFENLCKKIACGIGMLKWVRPLFLPKTLFSLARPHLDNCNYAWDSCSATHDNKFQKLKIELRITLFIHSNYDVKADFLMQ